MNEEGVSYESEYGPSRGRGLQPIHQTAEDFMRKKNTGMAGFLIRKGWARNGRQAQAYLVGVLCCAVILTALIFYFGAFGSSKSVRYNLSPQVVSKLPAEVQARINPPKK